MFLGGTKFIVKNILFKFALDVELTGRKGWLYGGGDLSDINNNIHSLLSNCCIRSPLG